MNRRTAPVALLTLFLAAAVPLRAGDNPLELIRSRDKDVRAYLAKNRLPLKTAQKEPLKTMLNDFFDYDTIALDALGGKNQKAANEKQMKEFLSLFREVTVSNSVSDKALEYYSEGKIQYKNPEQVGSKTVVSAKIKYRGEEVRLDYFFRKNKDGQWRIVDYSVDDASLVDTYRVSFTKIIKDNGFDELIKRLRTKRENPEDSRLGNPSNL